MKIKSCFVFVSSASETQHCPVRKHYFQAQNIIASDSIFQAPGSAGIGGNIAADGRMGLARGIRRVKETLLLDLLVQPIRVYAGLHDGDKVCAVDFANPIESFERKHNPTA